MSDDPWASRPSTPIDDIKRMMLDTGPPIPPPEGSVGPARYTCWGCGKKCALWNDGGGMLVPMCNRACFDARLKREVDAYFAHAPKDPDAQG